MTKFADRFNDKLVALSRYSSRCYGRRPGADAETTELCHEFDNVWTSVELSTQGFGDSWSQITAVIFAMCSGDIAVNHKHLFTLVMCLFHC